MSKALAQKLRISLPDRDGMDDDQQRVYSQIVDGRRGKLVGPLRAALHVPRLAEQWSKLGESLRFGTRLPPRLSELAVLMTARFWNSEVEWSIHRTIAQAAGLDDAIIDAIRDGSAPILTDPLDREIYSFVSQLLNTTNVTDAAYDQVLARWGEGGVVELTALVGYYGMVALTLNVHGIPLPNSVEEHLKTREIHPPKAPSFLPGLTD
ncbi:carboxymuconolactone decarboxylase family protein [Pelagibacterium luteolum]|uniref:4-carboxymuconolactone decarboxylase n=1 Tax=Pelagibacterium luteolum TaxID=440168 RepID=A0A1G8ABK7_9HYPH|nr:carboxymuconolactone decarboxylase family protein [Pelagibacterium luteolum]SDH18269.1 4-carboxymuconolactone decarboxylase [Pelagibacterium luteolum]